MAPNNSKGESTNSGGELPTKTLLVLSRGPIIQSFMQSFVEPTDPAYNSIPVDTYISQRDEDSKTFSNRITVGSASYNVNVITTPPPYGRRPNYKPLAAAIGKADAVIMLLKFAYSVEHYVQLIKKHSTSPKPVAFVYGNDATRPQNAENLNNCRKYCEANKIPFFECDEPVTGRLGVEVATKLVEDCERFIADPTCVPLASLADDVVERPFKRLALARKVIPKAEVSAVVPKVEVAAGSD